MENDPQYEDPSIVVESQPSPSEPVLSGLKKKKRKKRKQSVEETRLSALASAMKQLQQMTEFNSDTLSQAKLLSETDFAFRLSKSYPQSVKLQSYVCHFISNMALSENAANILLAHGCWDKICNLIVKYGDSPEVTWKACSALWNLSRPASGGEYIGAESLEVLYRVLREWPDHETVLYSAIGAFANLSVTVSDEVFVFLLDRVEELCKTFRVSPFSQRVAGQIGTFIANCAINDALGAKFVQHGAVELALEGIKRFGNADVACNCAAALHNLADVPMYDLALFRNHGLETLKATREWPDHHPETINYINEIFRVIGLVRHVEETSLMACCRRGYLNEGNLFDIMKRAHPTRLNDQGIMALDVAMIFNQTECTRLLVACNAPHTLPYTRFPKLEETIRRGTYQRQDLFALFRSTVQGATPLVYDTAGLVIELLPGHDLFNAAH